MPRKPLPPAEVHGPTVITATPPDIAEAEILMRREEAATALAVSQQDAMVRAVAQRLDYQLPADCTDPDLIQRDISANMRRSVEACLEIGKGLRVLKEACQHGAFMARLEVLGMEQRVANRFMQAAMKFSKWTAPSTLGVIGNQSKLFEMLVLDDEQIEELELTGQTGDLKLDDIADMSMKELRAALRNERAEHAATEKLLADKRSELENTRRKVAKLELRMPTWDERTDDFKREISERQNLLDKLIAAHLEASKALDVWYTNEVCASPDYNPEVVSTMPPAVQGVLLTLADAVDRTASLVAALQNELQARFGADIEDARRYLLLEPGEREIGSDA